MTDSAVIHWLQQMGQGTEADAEVFTDVLLAIPYRSSLVAGPLRPILLHQAVAKNHQLRQAARQLLTEAGIAPPIPVSTPLPTAYSLRINGSQSIFTAHLTDQNQEETFSSSPQDLVRPYGAIIDRLAEQANLDCSALCYRTLAIRDEVSSADESDDEKLVKNLHDANVKYDSFSLRTAAIRRAIMHLLTELLDAGAITEQWAARNLPVHDYAPASFPEAPKPLFIHTLKRHQATHVASDWVEAAASSPLLQQELSIYPPDWTVIGEYSLVRSLNWGTATETYRVHLANDQLIPDETEDEIFDVVFNQLTRAYYTLDELSLGSLVVRHRPYLHYPLKSWWLAFNPALARQLGWQPAPDHLFGWQDQANNLLVKSVYWVNGNIEMSPPRLASEAGVGWLVLASASALAQLRKVAGSLSVEKRLTRSHWRQEEQARAEQSASARLAYPDTGN